MEKNANIAIKLDSVMLQYKTRSFLDGASLHPVLDGISLEIHRGQTLGVIGRNGAGKSSLLKLLAGIISPNCGNVYRNGNKVLLLSYQLGFNRNYTGRQNAIHSALLQGVGRDEIESKMDEVIEFAGLREAIDDPLSTYSAGMKARLGFSVAIQCEADVILVDEALGVGDNEFRKKSMHFMREWIRSDKTVVFVSHDDSVVTSLCDRVVWLEGGRLVAEGEAKELMRYYHKFDHFVSCLAADLQLTEAEVRASEKARNPIAMIKELEEELRLQRSKEDVVPDTNSVVKYFRPNRSKALSMVVEEESGLFSWVENAKLIATGDGADIRRVHRAAREMTAKMAKALKMKESDFRKSDHYLRLLDVLVSVRNINTSE